MAHREKTEAEKHVVTLKHWRWMPGMLPTHGSRIIYCVGERAFVAYWDDEANDGDGDGDAHWFGTGLPDLTDPATLGCLRALVREAWRSPTANTIFVDGQWQCWVKNEDTPRGLHFDGATEQDALVAALEAAA